MGTKNNPGSFDCYTNAEPDEPMFVLLARDPLAPILVRMWAEIKERLSEDDEKTLEAFICANEMIDWRKKERPNKNIEAIRTLSAFQDHGIPIVKELASPLYDRVK